MEYDKRLNQAWKKVGSLTFITGTIVVVLLVVVACGTAVVHEIQEISRPCSNPTFIQPMSKSDALRYLRTQIPATLGDTYTNKREDNFLLDRDGYTVYTANYRRNVDEEHIYDTKYTWSLLGKFVSSRFSNETPVAPNNFPSRIEQYERLEKPSVTEKEEMSFYFKDVSAIVINHRYVGRDRGYYDVSMRGKQDGLFTWFSIYRVNGYPITKDGYPITKEADAYTVASALAALTPQLQQIMKTSPVPSSALCSSWHLPLGHSF